MSFHLDRHLPDCMMPDGGECCVGYRALVENWHAQRRKIERLYELLGKLTYSANIRTEIIEECAQLVKRMSDECIEAGRYDDVVSAIRALKEQK